VRVALCTPTYWPEVRRGAERFAHELAAGLRDRGHAPTILTSHAAPPARTTEDGITIVRSWRPPAERLRRRLYEDGLTHLPFTALELARHPPDAAIAVQAPDAVAAARWAPTVFAAMGIPHRAALVNRRGRLALTARACRDAAAVTALSDHARDAFHRWLGVEARVIHPPVDLRSFTPAAVRFPEPTIVCAAALDEPRKRVPLLIEAFSRVRRVHPKARLLLDRPRGPAPAVPPGVSFVVMDHQATLAGLYGRAWVSALPSWGEAFGLVLAEALACGTPVVGSDREGIPEVLGGDPAVGRLFAGDEAEPLAEALLDAIDLAADPRTAAACRARAERFSTDACAAAYDALLSEIA